MILPLPLLLGLLVAAIDCELLPTLPGSADLHTLLPMLLLLAVPTLLARAALRLSRAELVSSRRSAVPPRALLRLSNFATPVVVHALFLFGDWADWLDRLAWSSHLGRVLLATLPAFVAEVPRLGAATLAALHCEIADEPGRAGPVSRALLPGWPEVAGFVRMRLGGHLLVALPLVLLGGTLDLLQLHRPTYVLVLVTSPGLTVGTLVFLVLVVLVLPGWFRIAFAVQPLPEPVRAPLRATASALGFPPHRLHLLPTGMRTMNAMMVGPLPAGRCLCLTDAIVRELDTESLAGVVAHEVGHARMGHPSLLLMMVVVLPLALMVPSRLVDTDAWDPVWQATLAVGIVVAVWTLVRALAHRFEHEADVASVQALGAGPCSHALLVVSRLSQPVTRGWFGRVFTLHPEEPARWQLMRRYEFDPAFRAAFDARSRLLRGGIRALVAVATAAAAWACTIEWPYERVFWRLHAGDHRGALAAAAQVGEVPARWQRAWVQLEEQLAALRAWGQPADDWAGARAAWGEPAWRRGEEVLLAAGPAAARPWFTLVLSVADQATDLQRALHAYCDAAAEGDARRVAAMQDIVRRLGVPPRLLPVFAH